MYEVRTVTEETDPTFDSSGESVQLFIRHGDVIQRKLNIARELLEEVGCIAGVETWKQIYNVLPCVLINRADFEWSDYCTSCKDGLPCEIMRKVMDEEQTLFQDMVEYSALQIGERMLHNSTDEGSS